MICSISKKNIIASKYRLHAIGQIHLDFKHEHWFSKTKSLNVKVLNRGTALTVSIYIAIAELNHFRVESMREFSHRDTET